MRRNKQADKADTMALVLVNEMRRLDEAAERVRLVVRAMALRSGIRYEEPTD